jgi:hypothetical protein
MGLQCQISKHIFRRRRNVNMSTPLWYHLPPYGKKRTLCSWESFNSLNIIVRYVYCFLRHLSKQNSILYTHTKHLIFSCDSQNKHRHVPQNRLLNKLCQGDAGCLVWSRDGLTNITEMNARHRTVRNNLCFKERIREENIEEIMKIKYNKKKENSKKAKK